MQDREKQYIIRKNTETSTSVGVFFVRIFGGIGMATDFSKGMIAVATSYSGGQYHYEKLDPYMESLKIIPDSRQEQDSYRNANGGLKRPGIMPLVISKIDGNIPHANEKELDKVMIILEKGCKVPDGIANENKLRIRFYNNKTRKYKEAWAYYPDIEFDVYGTYKGDGKTEYNPTRIAFITYGEKRG